MLRTLFAVAGALVAASFTSGCTTTAEAEAIGNWSPRDQALVEDVLVIVRDKSGRHVNDGLCDRVERRFVEALTRKGYGVRKKEFDDAPASAGLREDGVMTDEGAVELATMANASAVLVVTIDDRIDDSRREAVTKTRNRKSSPADGWVSASLMLATTGAEVWTFSGVAPEPETADTRAVIERAAIVVAAELPTRRDPSAHRPT